MSEDDAGQSIDSDSDDSWDDEEDGSLPASEIGDDDDGSAAAATVGPPPRWRALPAAVVHTANEAAHSDVLDALSLRQTHPDSTLTGLE